MELIKKLARFLLKKEFESLNKENDLLQKWVYHHQKTIEFKYKEIRKLELQLKGKNELN